VDTRVQPGDLVLADDAVSLFFRPLARAAARDHEPRPVQAWRAAAPLVDRDLIELAETSARRVGVPLERGTLLGSLGPTYETPAEIRAWRRLGGTVASMSTVPEAIQARELGMRVLLFSLVTNLGTGLSPEPLNHEDVVAVADRAGAKLGRVLMELIRSLRDFPQR
jgi:purine-nucleoside phosphorylase